MNAQCPITGLIFGIFLLGCTPIEEPQLLDTQGNVVRVPAAYDTWLEIDDVSPTEGEIGVRPVFRVTFNAYVSTSNWLDYDVMYLVSGGIRASGRATWNIVERHMEWRPFGELIEGLEYRVEFNESRLESVTGAPPLVGTLPVFQVDPEVEQELADEPAPGTWEEVQEIVEERCASCHVDPEWRLNPLSLESMVGVKAEAMDVYLVKPWDAANSYLVHKILPDYPKRRFGVQPPIWSDEAPLSTTEMRLIASWIDNGAAR